MSNSTLLDRPYESLFICPASTPQTGVDSFIEKLKKTITEAKGTVRSVQVWGRRRLAYSIKHNKEGLYIYVDFDGDGATVKALSNLYHITDIVIRQMTVERQEMEAPTRTPSPSDPSIQKPPPDTKSTQAPPSETKETQNG